MAWQNSAAMGPNGGISGVDGGNNGGQPQGTEYTLQGGEDITPPFPLGETPCRVEAPSFAHVLIVASVVGVMRFLQMEWHRHERDRNAWQIERAEMKSRIGKLEGDGRTSKRLQESLGKHVKILENALRREREKSKLPPAEDQAAGDKGVANQANLSSKSAFKRMLDVRLPSI